MSVTQASDLFVPEVATEYFRQGFMTSLELMRMCVGGEGSPIQLMNEPTFNVEGQYLQRPTFARMTDPVDRRDITSTSSLTPGKLTGVNEIAVKVHRRIGPTDVSEDAARLSRATAEQISAEIGKQYGEFLAASMQHTLVAAALGVIGGMTATAHTATVWAAAARTNLSPALLNTGLQLMGDQRDIFRREAMIVSRSESLTDLINDASGRNYMGMGDKALGGNFEVNTYGMPRVMIDDSLLTTSDAGFDKYTTLLLGKGFMQVWFTLPLTLYPMFGPILDQEQVITRVRADCDFAVGAHGATWDVANGGANPTDAAIATITNWDPVYTSHKEVRGVKLVHNYSAN